jgi:MFS family permease
MLRPYLVVGLLNTSEGMVTMLVPLYMDRLGFAPTAVGLLVSVYAVASLISRLPAGALYRGHRARRLQYASLLAVIGTSLLYPLATTAGELMVVRALHGLAYGLATTVNLALFIDLLPPEASRHHALGYFTAALSFGFTIGQAISGFAAEWYGFAWAFVLAALPPLLAMAWVDAPPGARRSPRAALAPAAGPPTGWTRLRTPLHALASPGVLPMALLGFFLAFFLNVSSTFMPLFALAIGLGLAEIGVVRSLHSVANSITRPFSGTFIQRIGHARIAAGTLTLNALLLFLLPSFTTIVALGALMVVVGFVRGFGMVANAISVAQDVDEAHVSRGVASGIYYASRDLGGIVGPIVGGAIAGIVGIEAMFRIVPPLGLLAYFAGVAANQRFTSRQAPAPARSH